MLSLLSLLSFSNDSEYLRVTAFSLMLTLPSSLVSSPSKSEMYFFTILILLPVELLTLGEKGFELEQLGLGAEQLGPGAE